MKKMKADHLTVLGSAIVKMVLKEWASTAYIMAFGAGGCGIACHEVRYEGNFMELTHHMPSLTESAGKAVSKKNPAF